MMLGTLCNDSCGGLGSDWPLTRATIAVSPHPHARTVLCDLRRHSGPRAWVPPAIRPAVAAHHQDTQVGHLHGVSLSQIISSGQHPSPVLPPPPSLSPFLMFLFQMTVLKTTTSMSDSDQKIQFSAPSNRTRIKSDNARGPLSFSSATDDDCPGLSPGREGRRGCED